MPEIPNVVPGEPVEADWGNDIRDRSVQKYADQSALDVSQPFPQAGEVVWLDDPGQFRAWSGTAWVPLGDLSQPLSTPQQVERSDAVMAEWTRPGEGSVQHQVQPGGPYRVEVNGPHWSANVPYFGAFEVTGGTILVHAPTFGRVDVRRDDVADRAVRVAIASNGGMALQVGSASAPVSILTLEDDQISPAQPIRMSGNIGNRVHYRDGSSATLTPDFDAVWDALGSSPFPTDQQLYRGPAAVLADDAPDLDLADTMATMATVDAAAVLEDITVHAITQDGTPGVVMTSPTWPYGGTTRELVALLVSTVQDLQARVADLETS